MNRLIQLLRWLIKAWPILIPALGGIIHYEISIYFGHHIGTINKIVSLLVQLLGGILVLYSVNENIGMFKRGNLLQMIWKWFKEVPIKKRNYKLHAESITSGAIQFGEGRLTVTKKTTTLEERLDEIERRIEENRALLVNSEMKLNKRIDAISSDLRTEIDKNMSDLKKLEQLLTSSVVGSIKLQVFGVLLVLYGAIVSIL